MKISTGLQRVFEDAQLVAQRYACDYLETWHVLLSFVINHDTVAGAVLAEYPISISDYEHATFVVTDKVYREELDSFRILPSSKRLDETASFAKKIAEVVKARELGTEHLFMAMLLDKRSTASQILDKVGFCFEDSDDKFRFLDLRKNLEARAGFTKEDLKAIRSVMKGGKAKPTNMGQMMGMSPAPQSGGLEDYTRDLTALAREGKIEPVIGRDAEIARMIQILSRKTKNNPVLVGDAGVGKTALALGLAQRVAAGDVPVSLAKMRVLELDLMNVIAGTRFRGDFEERMNNIINDIEEDGQVILFIDELHTIMGSGSGIDSTLDAANILKPALARGTLRTVGATTQTEYQKHIEKDAALVRRFAKVTIEEPTVEDSIAILTGLKGTFEKYHRVRIGQAAVETAVTYAKRYLTSKNLPDSAIDLLDEASATVQNRVKGQAEETGLTSIDKALMDKKYKTVSKLLIKTKADAEASQKYDLEVTEEDVLETLSRLSGIPVAKLSQSDTKKYLNLEAELHKRVIGQEEAISAVSRAIRRNQSGIRTGRRPIGSFMFLGPTGVGKTELAKALAEVLFDDESALIRFDMSEYMEKFAASRLNGAPPGYVGYEEGGELTEKVRNKPYSVLLFDEVEKAHPDIFNVLLQVLDDGVLTDSKGRKVDFSNTIIIMTSNLGATALRDDKTVGFGALDLSKDHKEVEKRIFEELKKAYRPEFINRIDEKVVFHSLTETHMQDVVKVMIKPLLAVTAEKGITLKLQPSALKLLAKQGYDPEMGARPLRRLLQTKLEDPLAEMLLRGDLATGSTLKVGVKGEELKFDVVKG
ncbi:TPA: ATP-dependent Clp protease ATP-binding subunit [Streptococcus suis]|uniref:ATP-dependent Clp protease ATP-binding subunit n=1 Tax=Streptococcus suis TaxID=1307 RepID=A0A116M006_STRSU|nr:ATP-dependent Clp protease ATP-binding subunit [Streptococcus suis]MCQ8786255.1 ATP-dependent Clp protease ATP-binding subunit [Streptococcus suis]MDW8721203.1 ATP-dependent Clp protease ATP-binding subunit [Streptococcus suis]NQH41592.1 ATP-dependent Clp protease ATP-binding subunit [Streptococcus suis]NQH56708.1 ATP-dependent Clp protease ATP-binding subunit [Streptococcus suis]NQN64390.1 ATP-dependent Clp protease ATP-binding subunit [Streptococcus suis]